MKIAVLKERNAGEARVAATPDTVRKYVQAGIRVSVEAEAGFESYIPNDAYQAAGAQMAATAGETLSGAHVLLAVRAPDVALLPSIPEKCIIAGMLDPFRPSTPLAHYAKAHITAFALELLPRISRAQGMDVLSSQANLAGYRAVIEAVYALPKATPMMMTAAGTITPAKTLVLGAGVAGLQAIATAKRMGSVVTAFDVRAAAKEQVESLGAKFIAVESQESGEAKGGYAKEMSKEYQQRQMQLIHENIVKQDMVITTAQIPGRNAPTLITEEMVRGMKPGSVIVDLAAGSGGNCVLTEADKVSVRHGITLIGHTNLPSRVAADASALYARNLYNFASQILFDKQGNLDVQWDDELARGALLLRDGALAREGMQQQ